MKFTVCLFLSLFTALTVVAGPAPQRVPSFGPNGTHWPSLIPTPFIHDVQAHEIEVACTWAAIKAAIVSVTPEMAAAGVRIRVQPGTLTGGGSGYSSTASIRDCGSTAWTKRVLVCPRDGYGSVSITGGKAYRVFGVCFAGFIVPGTWNFHGCENSAMAWWKITGTFLFYGDRTGVVTQNVECSEIVIPDSRVHSGDAADIYSGGGDITNCRWDGCYYAPVFFAVPYSGGKPHSDTLQIGQPLGGKVMNVTFRDSAYFSSNNCAIQTGNVYGLTLDHCYVVSGSTSRSRYPHLAGGATEATTNAFNGSGQNLRAIDSTFIGGMALNTADAPKPWISAINTKVNRAFSSAALPVTGAWTVDTTLDETNSGMPPYPTDKYLEAVWGMQQAPAAPVEPLNLRINAS